MSGKLKLAVGVAMALGLAYVALVFFQNANIAVLSPDGPIGQKERSLILLAVGLSAIVVIPVYFMLVSFAWKYRESNKGAKYRPDYDHNRLIESVWWGVPIVIIIILAVATWKSSHELDPSRPIESNTKALNVQAVALQWRWLFIYPDYGIATVNLLQFPEKTPIKFDITADAPMNSFWIPQLGGQIYAMSGMSTKLYLMADKTGSYQGVSANISGKGFAKMSFAVNSVSQSDFDKWVGLVKQYRNNLSLGAYGKLSMPSEDSSLAYYSSVDSDLYHRIIESFTQPTAALIGGSL